jgi:hypothetical protein
VESRPTILLFEGLIPFLAVFHLVFMSTVHLLFEGVVIPAVGQISSFVKLLELFLISYLSYFTQWFPRHPLH